MQKRAQNREKPTSGDYLQVSVNSVFQLTRVKGVSVFDKIIMTSFNNDPDFQNDVDMENTRLSCDELLSMSRSLHEAEMSDASSQMSIHQRHLEAGDEEPCQRCLISSMSNRAILTEDCKHGQDENR